MVSPIEENVSLLDTGLVLTILAVGSVGHHDSSDLVDLGVKPASSDEPTELSVNVVLGHAEGVRHVAEGETPVIKRACTERNLSLRHKDQRNARNSPQPIIAQYLDGSPPMRGLHTTCRTPAAGRRP